MKRKVTTAQKLNIILIAVMLLFSASTFAWFAFLTRNTIEGFEFEMPDAQDVFLNVDLEGASDLTAYYGPGAKFDLGLSLDNITSDDSALNVYMETVQLSKVLVDNGYVQFQTSSPVNTYKFLPTGIYCNDEETPMAPAPTVVIYDNPETDGEWAEGDEVYMYENVYLWINRVIPAGTSANLWWQIQVADTAGLEIVGSVIDLKTYGNEPYVAP